MKLLTTVLDFLRERNAEAYLVGGFVRDQLLARAPARDIDVAIPDDAVVLARAFANTHDAAFYLMDAEHGVARVLFDEEYVDFADLRGDLQTDLATRDFTVNAMARRCDLLTASAEQLHLQLRDPRDLIDPFRGQDDLRARKIRAVSDGVFQKDPVRLLRAIRQAGELEFALESETETLIYRDAALLARAVAERAREEWLKCLALPNMAAFLQRLDRTGLLAAYLPEIIALKGVTQSPPHEFDVYEHTLRVVAELENLQAGGYTSVATGEFVWQLNAHFSESVLSGHTRATLLRFAALLHDVGKPATREIGENGKIHFYRHEMRGAEIVAQILRRMRFSNVELEMITDIVRHHLRPLWLAEEPTLSNRAAYRYFRATNVVGVDVCALSLADQRGKRSVIDAPADAQVRVTIHRLLDRYYHAAETVVAPPRLIDGKALIEELKIAPGRRVGELLEAIREAQAAGEVNTREEALALARNVLATEDTGSTEKK
ncbi:MAG: CCA tRNA nucleotidyltransferase [Chloroflexi bacterium]|nr:CCA tRNA nucleotidyltransferase [Chloroflexota bacterium]